MLILIILLWILFNGQLTTEIFVFGLIFAVIFYAFICKFFGFSVKKDIGYIKKSGYIIEYLIVLLIEIIKANICVSKMVMSSRYDVEPVVIKFRSSLKTEIARVILANSITLTPGTITIRLQYDEFTVHCLDKTLAEGIDNSVFVKLLERMERM